jgi:hypothetical protein
MVSGFFLFGMVGIICCFSNFAGSEYYVIHIQISNFKFITI